MSTSSLQETNCGEPNRVEDQSRCSSAFQAIECNCLNLREIDNGTTWWDTAVAPNDLGADQVAESIAYLESTNKIVRHPKRSLWIQVRQPDPSEDGL